MISIIVSSYIESYYQQFVNSLKTTIGVPYELIKIDNPGLYSTTEAYNLGATKAKYQILCFVHEDIIFHTVNWGRNLLDHFRNTSDLGLIGVAGASKKTYMPTGWMQHDETDKMNIIQHFAGKDTIHFNTQINQLIDFVKTVDGVFLAVRKDVWHEIKFDEKIVGYHLYDLDFSLRTSKFFKVAVVYDIIIEHFSSGSYASQDWIVATINYHKNKDKAHLFDHDTGGEYLIRNYYYALLLEKPLAVKLKFRYIRSLGVGKKSFFPALRFVLPNIGDFLESNYLKTKSVFELSKNDKKKR